MSSSKLQKSEVRIGHDLNELEKEFVTKRKQTVQQCLERNNINCPLDDLPKIALLGSGGGERAMLSLLGSLVELKKTDLLDCILYLSGISGSTWCMTSLYQDSDWSTNLDSVKEKIIQRLKGPGVSWSDAISKLKKYYHEKDIFSLTDFWATMIVTSFVKEINEHKISEQQGHDKDPFPIYTVIDKECRKTRDDPWFEINPYEAGYSLTGAFVDVSKFGSQFKNGRLIKNQPEMDMLYLQADCGSCIADEIINRQYVLEKIKEFIHHIFDRKEEIFEEMPNEANVSLELVHQLFMDLVEMNLSALKGEDPSAHEKAIRAKLTILDGGECKLEFQMEKTDIELYTKDFTLAVCEHLKLRFSFWPWNLISCIIMCFLLWIWGREYNFLYKKKDHAVPTVLQDSETRDYEDGGLCLNSPYMSVLRQERDIDIIISLDFSEGDPFETVIRAAQRCMEQNICFPKVHIPSVKYPKDFYVFEGNEKAPTVIHIPLFNTVNCGDKIEEDKHKFRTFQGPYSANKIDDLLKLAGKNITNNKEKLLDVIKKHIGQKSAER
nr:cytosolic phospholipase A2 gamma-like isoform X2 [Misgurnus anguillicaudatus]